MAKTRGGGIKQFVPKTSKNKKRKDEEPNLDSDTITEIDNYEDNSAQANDDVESSEEKTDSGDEKSSRYTRDTRDEDDDPLSLPICAREISSKPYNLTTWIDELGSFLAKISMKTRMVVYRDFRTLLVWIYEAFPHLGKYAKKSSDSRLPIPHLLRLYTTKSDKVIHLSTNKKYNEIVQPYLTPTIRETKQSYMATLKSYTNEVKDTVIDALKANLKDVIVLTSVV
ncbi:hypothetical protein H5410_050482 [Solanum commersonii]|uniref:Uncharacterized protein n=1 Tax=Solanum commersonii TaxID=4109 RepID=A0A9J5WWX0_SOLCO|nr:hypothetical protein H5410_050482 [Solanum commersonii]